MGEANCQALPDLRVVGGGNCDEGGSVVVKEEAESGHGEGDDGDGGEVVGDEFEHWGEHKKEAEGGGDDR